jgi:pyruvate carboxylase
METVIRAPHDAAVKQVHVKPGKKIAAKDLLVELS